MGVSGFRRALGAILRFPKLALADARANPVDTADAERVGRVLSSAHREWEDAGVFVAEFAQGFLGG